MTNKKDSMTYLQNGWIPKPNTSVQGGYVPTSSKLPVTPPTGGSGVKPAKK